MTMNQEMRAATRHEAGREMRCEMCQEAHHETGREPCHKASKEPHQEPRDEIRQELHREMRHETYQKPRREPHREIFYQNLYWSTADGAGGTSHAGFRRGALLDTGRIGEHALALHTQLDAGHIEYIVKTLKDTATNVGAGAAIYL